MVTEEEKGTGRMHEWNVMQDKRKEDEVEGEGGRVGRVERLWYLG